MNYKNLTLIGTSHIARESVQQVKEAISEQKPDIVAIELDVNRYYSLKSTRKTKMRLRDIFSIGVIGFLFALLGQWAQKKLGKLVGVMPGSEMLTAIRAARSSKADIKLIDQDIAITLKRLSKAITFREEIRFVSDILRSILFRKKEMERLGIGNLDLSKVPSQEIIKKLTSEFKKSYPNVYRVLVTERNHVMAKRLAFLIGNNAEKKIIAVIGAGHEEDMLNLIKKYENTISYSFTVT